MRGSLRLARRGRRSERAAAELPGEFEEVAAADRIEPRDVVVRVVDRGRVLRRHLVEQVVHRQRHPHAVVDPVLQRCVVEHGRADPRAVGGRARDVLVVVGLQRGQAADPLRMQRRGPCVPFPRNGGGALGLGYVPEVAVHREVVLQRSAIELAAVVAGEQRVGQGETPGADRRIQAVMGREVVAGDALLGDVDRLVEHAEQVAVGIAHHARHRIQAFGRIRIDGIPLDVHAQDAVGFHLQDPVHVHVLDLVRDLDIEVVDREVEIRVRRPHESGRERLAGLVVQVLVARARVAHAFAVAEAAALVVADGGGLGIVAAAEVVDLAGPEIVVAGEQVVQVRRAEAGAVGTADQQAVDRPPFQAEAIGELAGRFLRVAVLVVAAGHAQGQRLEHRHAEFAGDAPVAAVAVAVAVARAVVVVGQRERIRVDVVGLGTVFDVAGEADRARRQFEHGGVVDGEGKRVAARGRLEHRIGGDAVVLGLGQRLVELVGVGREDRVAVVVHALLRPEQEFVRRGRDDARIAHRGVVLRMVEQRFPVPGFADGAPEAGGDAQRLLRVARHHLAETAGFLRRELPVPVFPDAAVGVVEHPAVAVRRRALVLPAQRTGHEFDLGVTGLHVGEPGQLVVDVEVERAVHVGALAPALDGAVADRFAACAIEAVIALELGVGGAVVEAGVALAFVFRERGSVEPVVALEDPVAALVVGAVEGGILDLALVGPQRLLVQQLDADDAAQVAALEAGGEGELVRFAAAERGVAVAVVERGAVGGLLQDEVDHAGHRVRAVDRRGAASQHLDAVDHAQRDVADVGEVARAAQRQREVGDAAAVDQHQGLVRAEAAQVDLLRAGRGDRAHAGLLALGLAAVLGERAQHVGDGGETGGGNLLRGDHGDRRRALDLGARDARTGDFDRFELGRFRRGRGLGGRGRGCRRGRRFWRGRFLLVGLDDDHRAGRIVAGAVAASRQQLLQRIVRRHVAVHAAGPHALELVGAVEQLRPGLRGEGIQARDQVAGRDVDAARRGLSLLRPGEGCADATQGDEQRGTCRTIQGNPLPMDGGAARRSLKTVTNEPGRSRPAASLVVMQDDAIALVLGPDRETRLEQAHETIRVRPAEVAADPQRGDPGIAHFDALAAIAVELGRGRGERRVAEGEDAAAPAQRALGLGRGAEAQRGAVGVDFGHAAGRQEGGGLPVRRARVGRVQPHQAFGHDHAQPVAVAAHRETGADGGHFAAVDMHHERPARVLGHGEERFAALQVDVAFAPGQGHAHQAVAAERRARTVRERDVLERAGRAAVGALFDRRAAQQREPADRAGRDAAG